MCNRGDITMDVVEADDVCGRDFVWKVLVTVFRLARLLS